MHELLLFAQIPLQNHEHLLQILAGITAMQPLTLEEHHLLFKPTRLPSSLPTTNPSAAAAAAAASRTVKPGGPAPSSQSNDLFYVQLVEHLSLPPPSPPTVPATLLNGKDASEGESKQVSGKAKEGELDFSLHPWTLEFRDLPEVQGRRTVTSRLMSSVPVTAGDPVKFVEALGYKYITSYIQKGNQFTHNSISIRLTQTIPLTPSPSTSSSTAPPQPAPAPKDVSSRPRLDPSGAYLLQSSVRVQDGSNPDAMAKGMGELGQLKEMLKGVVELEVAERLSLDSRVR